MRLPRFLHQLYAFVFGYFWLPCPRCRRMFGGHEHRDDLQIGVSRGEPGVTAIVCLRCAEEVSTRFPKGAVIEIHPDTMAETDTGWRTIWN